MAKSKSAKSLKGIHRVRKKLSGGEVREYHYAYRGGPKFWTSDSGFAEGSQEYALAFAEALAGHSFAPTNVGKNKTRAVIDRYLRSAHFVNLGQRTQADYNKYLSAFVAEFGEDPIALFEEKEAVAEIREWKDK